MHIDVFFDFCSKLLERDVSKRMDSFEKIKKHPFFADVDWNQYFEKKITPPIPALKEYESGIDPGFLIELY